MKAKFEKLTAYFCQNKVSIVGGEENIVVIQKEFHARGSKGTGSTACTTRSKQCLIFMREGKKNV